MFFSQFTRRKLLKICLLNLTAPLKFVDCFIMSGILFLLLSHLLILINPAMNMNPSYYKRNNYRNRHKHVAPVENTSSVPSSVTVNGDIHNIEQIEYRLTRLEVQMVEKSENLRSELREANRRLQALEWQSAETQTALEDFRTELGRFTEQTPAVAAASAVPLQARNDKLEQRIENLSKGVQLVLATLKGMNSDISFIKNYTFTIVNKTTSIERENKQLLKQQFFSEAFTELKHHQLQDTRSLPINTVCTDRKEEIIPRSCKEVLDKGFLQSGIYRIKLEHSSKAFMALCDMNVEGGGWTYIHNRYEGAQDFYLNWYDYKHGFGNLGGEFWLGLDHIHKLTGSEIEGYALKILGGYKGNAGDSLMYHAGSKFSTKDMDQDAWPEGNCALAHTGAWWYRGCDTSNLNGKYLNGDLPEDYIYQGMYWGDFKGPQYSLLRARMLIRPRNVSNSPIFPEITNISKPAVTDYENYGKRILNKIE